MGARSLSAPNARFKRNLFCETVDKRICLFLHLSASRRWSSSARPARHGRPQRDAGSRRAAPAPAKRGMSPRLAGWSPTRPPAVKKGGMPSGHSPSAEAREGVNVDASKRNATRTNITKGAEETTPTAHDRYDVPCMGKSLTHLACAMGCRAFKGDEPRSRPTP